MLTPRLLAVGVVRWCRLGFQVVPYQRLGDKRWQSQKEMTPPAARDLFLSVTTERKQIHDQHVMPLIPKTLSSL